jgi:hyaluronate lyase
VVGTWSYTTYWPGYYDAGCLVHDKNATGGTMIFRPLLPEAGDYSVYIQYPGVSSQTWQMSTAVPLDVAHAGGTNTLTLNQRQNYGVWYLLGQFPFEPGTNGYVRIRTEGTSGFYVPGDAVRFVK